MMTIVAAIVLSTWGSNFYELNTLLCVLFLSLSFSNVIMESLVQPYQFAKKNRRAKANNTHTVIINR